MSHNHTDTSNELLSAYIDGAVDAVEQRRAERLIDSCAACAQEVQELRMFRELLRELPNVQPRRSFTLDPATVAPPRRLLFPTLRWSSLVAAALFVVVLGVDALGVGRNPSMPMSFAPAAAPEAATKSDPAGQSQMSGADSAGGSAETMMVPASPAASAAPQGDAAAQASPPAVASVPTAVAGESVEASPAAGAALPQVAASAAPESSAAAGNAAGGTAADQPLQPQFRADQPAGAETRAFDQTAPAQGSWWSSYTLRVVEVALGMIALVLGGAALWAWRRQL